MLCLKKMNKVISDGKSEEGSTCCFYRLGDTGIKTWYSESIAIDCHYKQTELAGFGLAPAILSPVFTSIDICDNKIWGFQTEVVVIFGESMNEPPYCENIDRCVYDLISIVQKEIMARDWYDADAHKCNYGVLKDGRIVCIDMSGVFPYDGDHY